MIVLFLHQLIDNRGEAFTLMASLWQAPFPARREGSAMRR
jgi:hypothetical protein